MRNLLLLALLISSGAFAQIPAPQINLSGNIGCQGFPCVNSGTLQFTSDANHTMTAQESSAFNIKVTSSVSLTATRNLISPAGRFAFTIENSTTGGQSIQIIGPSGTGITIPNGSTVSVWNDGTNYVQTIVGSSYPGITSSGTGGLAGNPGSGQTWSISGLGTYTWATGVACDWGQTVSDELFCSVQGDATSSMVYQSNGQAVFESVGTGSAPAIFGIGNPSSSGSAQVVNSGTGPIIISANSGLVEIDTHSHGTTFGGTVQVPTGGGINQATAGSATKTYATDGSTPTLVTQIIAGTNTTISSTGGGGTGAVTINSGGSGTVTSCATAGALAYYSSAGTIVQCPTTAPTTSSSGALNVPGLFSLTSTTLPALTSCGGGTPTVTGNENIFAVVPGSGAPTACTVNFSPALVKGICVAVGVGAADLGSVSVNANSTTAVTFNLSAATESFNAFCS